MQRIELFQIVDRNLLEQFVPPVFLCQRVLASMYLSIQRQNLFLDPLQGGIVILEVYRCFIVSIQHFLKPEWRAGHDKRALHELQCLEQTLEIVDCRYVDPIHLGKIQDDESRAFQGEIVDRFEYVPYQQS